MSTLAAYAISPDVDPLTFNVKLDDLQQIPNCTLHIKTGQDGTYDQHVPYVVNSSVTLASGIQVLMGDFGLPTAITALKRTARYYFQVTNASGSTNDVVVEYNGSVDTSRPQIDPNTIVVSNITTSGATVAWTSEANATNSVEIAPSINFSSLTSIAATSGVTASATLTGLSPDTIYFCRVRSTDTNGNSGVANVPGGTPVGTFRTNAINTGGQLLWAIPLFTTGAGKLHTYSVACNQNTGDIFAAFYFIGTFDPKNGQAAITCAGPNANGLLMKLNSSGVIQWARQIGTNPQENIALQSLVVDSTGSVIVGLNFHGTVDFGGISKTAGGADLAIAKYPPGIYGIPPNATWVTHVTSQYDILNVKVALDSAENILVGTDTRGTMDFGGGNTVTNNGGSDIVVAKLNSLGVTQWAKNWGGANDEFCLGICADSSDNAFVTGTFLTSTNLGGATLTALGLRETFRAIYDGTDGSHLFSAKMGSAKADTAGGCAANLLNNTEIFVGSVTQLDGASTTVNYGDGDQAVTGTASVVAAYDTAGLCAWQRFFGDGYSGGTHLPFGVVVDSAGQILVTGTAGSMFFGIIAGQYVWLTSYGYFIFMLDNDGIHLWSRKAQGTSGIGVSISLAESGSVVVGGNFLAQLIFDGGTTITAPSSLGQDAAFLVKYRI